MPECLIEVQDEVNVRLRGVPKYIIDKAREPVTWHVPGFPHMPAYKTGRWDGTVSLLSKTGKTFINMLDKILPVLEEADFEFEIEDNRYDWSHVDEDIILPSEDMFAEYSWPNGDPVMLRDYQIDAVHAAIKAGQGILEMSTGSGKTISCATMAKVYSKYGKVILIVPNIDLAIQTQALFKMLGLDPGIWYGEMKDARDITITTWQSLDHFPELMVDVVCVIVDECFSGDTPILTPTGWVPIENINVGDLVVSYNDDGKVVFNPVVKVHENITPPTEDFYELEMDDGTSIKVTGNHKFMTTDGWVRADELTPEHDIVSMSTDTPREGESFNEVNEQNKKD